MEDRFKFRVWNKENKKLYDWNFLEKTKNDNALFWCMLQAQNDCKHNILMQSTGLKDKNGKLIYEGDIVDIWCKNLIKNQLSDVFYCEERAGFCFNYETDYGNIVPCSMDKCIVEVIGNIWENKDLLKEGKE